MTKSTILWIFIISSAHISWAQNTGCFLFGSSLTTESMKRPLGISLFSLGSPRLSWMLLSSDIQNCKNQTQKAYHVLVALSPDTLNRNVGDLWDSGMVFSSNTLNVLYRGKILPSAARAYWKVIVWDDKGTKKDSSTFNNGDGLAWWETGLLESTDWHGKWMERFYPSPPVNPCDFYRVDPVPLFRKQFSIANKPIKSARLYISALGYYTLYLNGVRISLNQYGYPPELDPPFSSFSSTIIYSSYDITGYLQGGNNSIGIMAGNGWYNPLPLLFWGSLNLRDHLTVGNTSAVLLQLNVLYNDSSTAEIFSDQSWKVGQGPILRNSIYLGEVYDANKEVKGWSTTSFDDRTWTNAVLSKNVPKGKLIGSYIPPIRAFEPLPSIAFTSPAPNTYVVDLGRNFGGWAELNVSGAQPNQTFYLKYGELLFPTGRVNGMTSVAGQIKSGNGGPCAPTVAYQLDTYIAKGLPFPQIETYRPTFTWHGFRYVEITTDTGTSLPPRITMRGIPLHTDIPIIGNFTSSNKMLNDIQRMVQNTFLSNMFSIQSDCPHRERFGYGGDAVAASKAAMYNFDMSTFYRKRVRDYADASDEFGGGGGMTETSPFVGISDAGLGGATGPVEWDTFFLHAQLELFKFTGDTTLLSEQYSKSKSWMSFLESYGMHHNDAVDVGLGDWDAVQPASVPFTSNIFYLYNYKVMASISGLLNMTNDAEYYSQRAEVIAKNINVRFLNSTSPKSAIYANGVQSAQAFALWHSVVPPQLEAGAFSALVAQIEANGGHMTVGMFAILYILEVCSQMSRSDLAYKMLTKTSYPSFGYMLKNNATTLWEVWEFSDNTYSHNHPMFGSPSTWFFEYLAGIQMQEGSVAFDRIAIKPQIVLGDPNSRKSGVTAAVNWVNASYLSARGLIETYWSFGNATFCLNVCIPPNVVAEINLPTIPSPKRGTPQIHQKQQTSMQVGSGTYNFCIQ